MSGFYLLQSGLLLAVGFVAMRCFSLLRSKRWVVNASVWVAATCCALTLFITFGLLHAGAFALGVVVGRIYTSVDLARAKWQFARNIIPMSVAKRAARSFWTKRARRNQKEPVPILFAPYPPHDICFDRTEEQILRICGRR